MSTATAAAPAPVSGGKKATAPVVPLFGLMQRGALMISSLIEHANKQYADVELVSRNVEDGSKWTRSTYGAAYVRIKKLANALRRWGVKPGDRVATLAWNTVRHFELYYAISGIGAVLHTLNPRLFVEQLHYIINHADDTILFFDVTFFKLIDQLRPLIRCKKFVVMTDAAHMPASCLPLESLKFPDCPFTGPIRALCYEHVIASEKGATDWEWPVFDEYTASSLCYTSGTTGNPKGVLYSHRSTLLHSFSVCTRDCFNLSSLDAIYLVVPLFHANAWGLPYAAAMCGAKIVFPAEHLGGADIYKALTEEKITFSCGVPTVWLAVLQHIDSLLTAQGKAAGGKTELLPYLQRVGIGGSSCPPSMIRRFLTGFANPIHVLHLWGMTEMSPLGSVCNLLPKHQALSVEGKLVHMAKQGRMLYGVDASVIDDEGKHLPRDGASSGNLVVRGPWCASGYYNDAKATEKLLVKGTEWMQTGDVATLDADGFMTITDRSKDVIKSGGEWISSIDLENSAVGHPAVAEAAVIGLPHPKWQERPLLIVVRKSSAAGAALSKAELLKFLEHSGVAKWSLPDDVVFVKELPHTATGKLLKTKLREQFKDHKLPEVAFTPRSAL